MCPVFTVIDAVFLYIQVLLSKLNDMRQRRYWKVVIFSLIITFLLVDVLVGRVLLHWGFRYDTTEFRRQRYDVPYVEFTGQPDVLDHNVFGYRGKSITEAPDSAFVILFFGGSTGYYGEPPVPVLLEELLTKTLDRTVFVVNASVVSSNHNQHLHALLEQFISYPADLVLFYGGYNENIQPLYYDPRPGYPFNFYYKHECAPWRLYLMKYSSVFGEMEKRYRVISGMNTFRKKFAANPEEWHHSIARNYMDVLQKTHHLVTRTMVNQQGSSARFVAFYQPYKVPEEYIKQHQQLRHDIPQYAYMKDISTCLDSISAVRQTFTDDVHVSQQANEIVAGVLADSILHMLKP